MARKCYGIYIKRHNGSVTRTWFVDPGARDAAYDRYQGRANEVGKGRMIFYVKKIQRS